MRLLCALAILFMGFAHQPAASREIGPLDVSAYALPDGSIPVFCISDSGDGQKDRHFVFHGCDACRIGASILLPSPADMLGRATPFAVAAALQPPDFIVHRRILSPGAPPRAPPLG